MEGGRGKSCLGLRVVGLGDCSKGMGYGWCGGDWWGLGVEDIYLRRRGEDGREEGIGLLLLGVDFCKGFFFY